MREEEMDCKEIYELLTAYLDGEITPEEKAYIDTHLSGCPQCRHELEAFSATRENLRGALMAMAEESVPSPQTWAKIKDRLGTKESRRGFWSNFTLGRIATAASAVVVLVIAVVVWQFGGFFFGGMSSLPPAPTSVPAPTPMPYETPPPPIITIPEAPLPLPAPPLPVQVSIVPEDAHYLPGETIEVSLSLSNISSEPVTVEPYPVAVQVTSTSGKVWYVTTEPKEAEAAMLIPGQEKGLVFTWDQQDQSGKQVPPGWYNIIFGEITVIQGDNRASFTPGSRVLIQYPQGAMEKNIELNQPQDITVELQGIELTAAGMTVYAFCIPPGYTPPQGILPTSRLMVASAEYSVDGSAVKDAGFAGFRPQEDGIRFTWKDLDPMPADAKELAFSITMRWEDKPDELLGPWEFKIPLE